MTAVRSGLYAGKVVHRRLAPKDHLFVYRVFSLLLDLDELDSADRRTRLFSVNRFNLFSFFDRDHGDRSGAPLKGQIEALLEEAGVALDGGSISLLCYPRVLGYVFNPISIYFCHGADGALRALVYEVTNTFHERHTYVFPVEKGDAAPFRHSCPKALYVSPFIGMEARYHFAIVPPDERLAVAIRETDPSGPVLNASFTAKRAKLSDATLAGYGVSYLLMTVKVMAGIHWEAFKLWRKGIGIHTHRPPPAQTATIVDKPE